MGQGLGVSEWQSSSNIHVHVVNVIHVHVHYLSCNWRCIQPCTPSSNYCAHVLFTQVKQMCAYHTAVLSHCCSGTMCPASLSLFHSSLSEQNLISVWNGGRGIPIEMHATEKMYVPELSRAPNSKTRIVDHNTNLLAPSKHLSKNHYSIHRECRLQLKECGAVACYCISFKITCMKMLFAC